MPVGRSCTVPLRSMPSVEMLLALLPEDEPPLRPNLNPPRPPPPLASILKVSSFVVVCEVSNSTDWDLELSPDSVANQPPFVPLLVVTAFLSPVVVLR